MEIGLPHVRTLVVVEKSSAKKSAPEELDETISYYLSSHHPRRAEFFAGLIRGHWGGCEIRNHWVRDALFEEDATRSRNLNLNGNLAILRGSLIALKAALAPHQSWPFIHELSSMKVSLPYNLVCKNLFK
jgi:predicted transposase YbfD/YdcC